MKLQSIDPSTGELIESFDEISDAELEAALARAQQCIKPWSFDQPPFGRCPDR